MTENETDHESDDEERGDDHEDETADQTQYGGTEDDELVGAEGGDDDS